MDLTKTNLGSVLSLDPRQFIQWVCAAKPQKISQNRIETGIISYNERHVLAQLYWCNEKKVVFKETFFFDFVHNDVTVFRVRFPRFRPKLIQFVLFKGYRHSEAAVINTSVNGTTHALRFAVPMNVSLSTQISGITVYITYQNQTDMMFYPLDIFVQKRR